MMWVMTIGCIVPLLFVVFFWRGDKAIDVPTWIVLSGIAIVVGVHFLMMVKSHKHSDKDRVAGENKESNMNSKKHSNHGCCH